MSDVTQLLDAAAAGDRQAAADLLPLVYDQRRQFAAARMAAESPDQTLQPTALVHEACLRLIGPADQRCWDNRGHFFTAAAEAMRRILIDNARRKAAARHGGAMQRHAVDAHAVSLPEPREDLRALVEGLNELEADDLLKAKLVILRYFTGLSLAEAAAALGLSERPAGRHWAFARAWLRRAVEGSREGEE